jgi:predicted ABC-type ATPase
MLYVLLDSAELQMRRIAIRVSEGGHDVPVDKVVSRRLRSFEQLGWFMPVVDQCFIFNNSTGKPQLAGIWDGNERRLGIHSNLPHDMQNALKLAGIKMIHHLR